ncbi:heat shock mitochondrial protein, putative [Babesia ovata]|uniref:Heat shock mitochondrial protein, putative n=1 Tax=Babesia ovata TaxID=189622 RepID=A0A2H6K7T5_9APIC|nr:heat shock mitochondrial protein, putative [Babesia ovata]GBE59038.1 heat shock mitochondrial protein, putative [Babesia ovata]
MPSRSDSDAAVADDAGTESSNLTLLWRPGAGASTSYSAVSCDCEPGRRGDTTIMLGDAFVNANVSAAVFSGGDVVDAFNPETSMDLVMSSLSSIRLRSSEKPNPVVLGPEVRA